MKTKLGVFFSLFLALSLLLASCAPAAPSPATEAAKPAEAAQATEAAAVTEAAASQATETAVAATEAGGPIKRGGTLRYSRGILPLLMDPKSSSASGDIFVLINTMEPLIRYDILKKEYVGIVADKFSVSDDGLEYDFHIRDGILFNDGTPVTSEDVKFTFELAQKEGVWQYLQENVKEIVAVDDQNVKIIMSKPTAPFLNSVAQYSVWIISKKAYEAAKDPDTFYRNAVTTGPFMVKEWVVGDHTTLVRNPHYWRMGEDGQPLPYLDEILLTQVPEDTTRILQVQSGSLDGTDAVTWSQVNQLKDDPVADMKTWDSMQTYYIFINHKRPPFDDKNIRLALNYAIDRQAVVDTVMDGYGIPAYTFVPYADPCKDMTQYFTYDVEKAKELVKASKYPDGYTGGKISVPQGRIIGIDNATMMIDYWSKIGINLTIEEVEGGILSQRSQARDIDAISGYQWTSSAFDLDQQMNWFIIEPTFYGNYVNLDSQKLVREAANEMDPVKRCDMYKQIQKNFAEDGANVVLFHTYYNTFFRKDVKGYYLLPSYYLDLATIWLDR